MTLNLDWLAGFYEGGGCPGYKSNSFQLCLAQKDVEVLNLVAET